MQTLATIAEAKYRRNSKEENSNKETSAVTDEELIRQCSQSVGNYKHLMALYREHPCELIEFLRHALNHATSLYRYVNKATSWAQWPATLEDWTRNLAKALNVARYVPQIIERLKASKEQARIIRGIVWRFGQGAERYAVQAQETGRNRFKYFCWLTSNSGQKAINKPVA